MCLAYKCKFCLSATALSCTECNFQDIPLESYHCNFALIFLYSFTCDCFAKNQLKRLNSCTNFVDLQLKCLIKVHTLSNGPRLWGGDWAKVVRRPLEKRMLMRPCGFVLQSCMEQQYINIGQIPVASLHQLQ